MKTRTPSAKIIIGHGAARTWADNASTVDSDDADLLAAARAARLFDLARRDGYADRGDNLIHEGWLLVCTVDDSDLDHDPAVIAYCAAPTATEVAS